MAETEKQAIQELGTAEKEQDKEANQMISNILEYLDWKKEHYAGGISLSYDTLVITVGIAKHDSPYTQLVELIESLIPMTNIEENEEKNDIVLSKTILLHFDAEWDTKKSNKKTKLDSNISDLLNYRINYSRPSHEVREEYDFGVRSGMAKYMRKLDKNLNPIYTEGLSEYLMPDIDNLYHKYIQENSTRSKFRPRYMHEELYFDHFFIPYNLISYYSNPGEIYRRHVFAKSKKTVAEFANGCPPVDGSTYDTLQKMIDTYKFKKIIIYNAAYWKTNTAIINNGKPKPVSFLQNLYFDGMCELLNIVLNTGKDVEKYIFDTEFERIEGRRVYSHKNAKTVKSLIKDPRHANYRTIGTFYPLNETTAFRGGKRKTRKQKKRL
jgi:hypothetical protein